jgi:hypothetical protein
VQVGSPGGPSTAPRLAARSALIVASVALVAGAAAWRGGGGGDAASARTGPGPVADSDAPWVAHGPPGMVAPGASLPVSFRVSCPPDPSSGRPLDCAPGSVAVSYRTAGAAKDASAAVDFDPSDGSYRATLPPFEGTLRYTATVTDPRFATVRSSWTAIAVAPRDVVLTTEDLQRPGSGRAAARRPWSADAVRVDYGRSVPVVPPAVEALPSGELVVPDPVGGDLVVLDGALGSVGRRIPSPVPVETIADLRALPGQATAVAVLSQSAADGVRLQRVDVATGASGPSVDVPGESAGRLVHAGDGLHLVAYPGPVAHPVNVADDGTFRFGPATQDLPLEDGATGTGLRVRVTGADATYCLQHDGAPQWCVRATAPWTFGDVPFAASLADGSAVVVQRLYQDTGPGHPARYFALHLEGGELRAVTPIDLGDEMDVPIGGRFRLTGGELRHLSPTPQDLRVMAYPVEDRS